jgi:stress-induced morphogen
MPMPASEIERRIKAALPDATIEITDLAGDDNHWSATVTSEQFRGKSRVQQHQLVYTAIGTDMGGALHALQLQTGVPE